LCNIYVLSIYCTGYRNTKTINDEDDGVNNSEEISHWKTLTVDLEKKKVVFPDWINANHHKGSISTIL
jgi:hypothetical protein